MPATTQLLTDFETCPRKGFWSQKWASKRLISSRMVQEAIRYAILARINSNEQPEACFGQLAGDYVMGLARDRGLDTELHDLYACVVHHASLADIVVSAIRKSGDEPWLVPPPVQNWTSGCFLSPDGSHLRRIVLVSHWSDERETSEKRSWYTLGEIAHYNLPMQLVVVIIGQQRNGKRSSPWCKGFLHPSNRTLRFRKKERTTSEIFNSRWIQAKREDHAEISRETWLNAMLKDDVLQEVLFRIDLPVLPEDQRNRVLGIAHNKLDRLSALKTLPEPNLSSCDWPQPCSFKRCCWGAKERMPSEGTGYIQIT